MRGTITWLYGYNAEAFEKAFGRPAADYPETELGDILAFGLGYVDYSKPSLAADLLKEAEGFPPIGSLFVRTRLEDSSEDAFRQGLAALAEEYEDAEELPDWWQGYREISDDDFAGMMAYALGFIDYEVLAREYPNR